MFGLFGGKKAVIAKLDMHTSEIDVSDDFASVHLANNALTHIVNSDNNLIVYNKDVNDYDGTIYDCAERQEDHTLFHDVRFEVFPVDKL